MKIRARETVVALTALVVTAVPAYAYNVSIGGPGPSITVPVTSPPSTAIVHLPAVPVQCASQDGDLTVYGGPSSGGVDVAELDIHTWTGCTSPAIGPVTVTQVRPLKLHLWEENVTPAPTDTINGYVAGTELQIRSLVPGLCEYDLIGWTRFHFVESSQFVALHAPNTLKAINVSGCSGLVSPGDLATSHWHLGASPGTTSINFQP